jgi:hypothetical protein
MRASNAQAEALNSQALEIYRKVSGPEHAEEYNGNGNAELLKEARQYFSTVIALIPDTEEAQRSRGYIAKIDTVLPH